MSDLTAFLAQSRERVDRELDRFMPRPDVAPEALHEAMRYAVMNGGKRVRPTLAFAAAQAVGVDAAVALPVAAAVELIHAYSLVHDDLPAMDDDALRRGQPTVHVKFGEALAILTGDALLTLAFARLACDDVPRNHVPELVAGLAAAGGSTALVGGQVEDLALDPARADRATIERIHARKTAALFAFAATGGAAIAGAPSDRVAAVRGFATSFGLAFQAADDLLDGGRDETSILLVCDDDEARARIESSLDDACAAIAPLGRPAAILTALADTLRERIS